MANIIYPLHDERDRRMIYRFSEGEGCLVCDDSEIAIYGEEHAVMRALVKRWSPNWPYEFYSLDTIEPRPEYVGGRRII